MIHMKNTAARIASMRKRRGYTQAELAEQLNVSPQAVSKWETGLALPDIELLLAISHLFAVSINEILEGDDAIRRIANRAYESDDIIYFVPREEREDNAEWAKAIVHDGWVKRNWDEVRDRPGWSAEFARRIVQHGGLILEIGTGPGGGYVPAILTQKSDAQIIVSDISPHRRARMEASVRTRVFSAKRAVRGAGQLRSSLSGQQH